MWSAKNGTPNSSLICLLPVYQGAPVTRRRHLECETCNLPTRVWAAKLHMGHSYSIIGQTNCLYSRAPFHTSLGILLGISGWNCVSKLSVIASGYSESQKVIPSGVTRGGDGENSHHRFSHLPQRLVLDIKRLPCRPSLVSPPISWKVVDLCRP